MTDIRNLIEPEIEIDNIVSDITAGTGSEYFQFIYKNVLVFVRHADHVAGNETKKNSSKTFEGFENVYPSSYHYRNGIAVNVKGTINLNVNPKCSFKNAIEYLNNTIN